MADVIRHKRSSTASAVPSSGQLELGELAVNVADGRLYFKKSNGDIVSVANLADAWALHPLGVPFPIWTHMTGAQIPPTDNPNYRYIKLTASDSYNTGVLTSESVSGSAPLVQATAVISDSGSPLNGQPVRLINTEGRVIRAGSSGTVLAAAMQGHSHQQSIARGASSGTTQSLQFGGGSNTPILLGAASATTDSDFGPISVANETRAKSIGADYFMRIR